MCAQNSFPHLFQGNQKSAILRTLFNAQNVNFPYNAAKNASCNSFHIKLLNCRFKLWKNVSKRESFHFLEVSNVFFATKNLISYLFSTKSFR